MGSLSEELAPQPLAVPVAEGKDKGGRVTFAGPEGEEDAGGPATRSRTRRAAATAASMNQGPSQAEGSRVGKRKREEVEEVEEKEVRVEKEEKKAKSIVAKVIRQFP